MDATPLFKPTDSAAPEPAEPASFAPRPRKYLPGRLLDAYLFGHVAEATLRGLAMFVMLLLFFAVITATRKMLDNSVSGGGALLLVAYQLPRMCLFALPMSVLYGTLHAFSDLSTSGQIIGMWGGGMSFKRMLVPPLIWASVLSALSFVVQETIVPTAESSKDKVLASQIAQSTSVQKDIDKKFKQADGSELRLEAREFDARTKTLLAPRVTKYRASGDIDSSVRADKAAWDAASKKWRATNQRSQSWSSPEQSAQAATISSEGHVVELDAPDPTLLGKPALSRAQNLSKHNFEFVSIQDLQSWKALNEEQARSPALSAEERRDAGKEARSATYGIHDKIASPLICVALVLIGAPLGMRPQRSAGGFSFGLSMIVLLVYYVVWTWANQVGRGGSVDPYLMAYFPLALSTAVGAALSWQKAR